MREDKELNKLLDWLKSPHTRLAVHGKTLHCYGPGEFHRTLKLI